MITPKTNPTIEEVLALFFTAPTYEFNKGVKAQGFFQKDLDTMCVPKRIVKKLVKKQKLKYAQVTLKRTGMLVFYSLNKEALTNDLQRKAHP